MLSSTPPAESPLRGRTPATSMPPIQQFPGHGHRRAAPLLQILGIAIAAWGDPERVVEAAAQADVLSSATCEDD